MLEQLLFALSLAAPPTAPAGPPTDEVGFAGREIYAFADGLFGLMHGDWNGDGVQDLAVVNRARARIEILVRLDPSAEDRPFFDDREAEDTLNRVLYDGRYLRLDFPVERRVWRAAAADVDGDGRDEIAFASDGGRITLVTLDAADDEAQTPTPRLLLRSDFDGLRRGTTWLSGEDLNGDGRDDLVALGEGELFGIEARTDDRGQVALAPPEVLDYPGEGLAGVHLVDLDQDGAQDLLTVHYEREHPFRFRLRQADGGFGPRTDLELAPIRAHALGDLDGDGADEIACILQVSGRIACVEPTELARPPLLRHSLGNPTTDAARSFEVADLDGDGTDDLIVANADTARVLLLLGQRGKIAPRRSEAPSLAGVASPRAGDVDGDGRTDLLVVSGPERVIGTSALDDAGRLSFPETRAAEGEPAAGDLYDVDGDGYDDAVVLSTTGEGRRREYRLSTWRGGPEGLAAQPEVHLLEGFEKVPSALRVADLDHDGRADYVFYPSTSNVLPLLFFGTDGEPIADTRGEDAPGMGLLEGAGLGRFEIGDLDGDGAADALVATATFARGLWLEREAGDAPRWLPQVLGQWSAPAGDARIAGAAAADLNGDGRPEIVLRDDASREGLVLDAGDGSLLARFEAGRLDFQRFERGDLDGDGREEIVVLGKHQIGVVFGALPGAGAPSPAGLGLVEFARYEAETPRFPQRLAVADFDGDGRSEVVSTEQIHHGVRLLTLGEASGAELGSLLVFPVFEEKTFGGASNTREPRELTVADLTGDGRADIAVLVHNKLILYPQQ